MLTAKSLCLKRHLFDKSKGQDWFKIVKGLFFSYVRGLVMVPCDDDSLCNEPAMRFKKEYRHCSIHNAMPAFWLMMEL